MKTSQSQFDIMVTFMEQHGDLSKPSSNAKGRISSIRKWDELVQILNCDGFGDTKTPEKWKKVWSDLKSNTKKKAARLHRAAIGTGGGPANVSKLNDLEQRILCLIGVQASTGLAVDEAGLSQASHSQQQATPTQEPQEPQEPFQVSDSQNENNPIVILTQSPTQPRVICSPAHNFIVEEVQSSQYFEQPGPSTSAPAASLPVDTQFAETHVISPSRLPSHSREVYAQPSPYHVNTPRRNRTARPRVSPRRRLRPAHTEQAAQQFLQAEEFWRKFKIDQHRDYMDLRREQNRIREMEVQTQREWQSIGSRALDILNKLVDKYCED